MKKSFFGTKLAFLLCIIISFPHQMNIARGGNERYDIWLHFLFTIMLCQNIDMVPIFAKMCAYLVKSRGLLKDPFLQGMVHLQRNLRDFLLLIY